MAYQAPDYGGYTRKRANVEDQYGTQATTNAYGRFLGQQRFERNTGDAKRQFGRSYAPRKATFGQRGLSGGGINSGAMKQSMGNYVGDYVRGQQRMGQDQTLANQQYDLQGANLDKWRQDAIAEIEQQKANEIAWTAQNLTELRSMLGGN